MEEVTVEYKGQVYTLQVPAGTGEDQIRAFLQQQVPAQPVAPSLGDRLLQAATPESAVTAGALSAANSALFGVPEMAARAVGMGPAIDATREQYPVATTAGDIAGLANPARLGMRLVDRGIARMAQRGSRGREATAQALSQTEQQARSADNVREMAQALRASQGPSAGQLVQGVARRGGQLAGATLGAQTAATTMGAARSPNQPMAGAQQGAQVFRQAAMNAPGLNLIPGAQQTVGAVTNIIPTTMGMGQLAIDNMIREEAARRALRGPQ